MLALGDMLRAYTRIATHALSVDRLHAGSVVFPCRWGAPDRRTGKMQITRYNGRVVDPPDPPFKTRPAPVLVHISLLLCRWGIR